MSILYHQRIQVPTRPTNMVFNDGKTFINDHEHNEIPAQQTHVALYITYLLISWASHSTVNTANNSITWMHEISNFPNHTEITSDHQIL